MSGYSKPRSGQAIGSGPARSAAFFADAMDVIDSFKRGGAPPGQQNGDNRGGSIIFIRNDTGADLKLGQVVELGAYLLDSENPYKWWLEGKAVSTTFNARYAVAAEAIPEDTIGAAWVRGPAIIRYAGTSPAQGDGIGPKPSTVTLEKGYPCFAVVDDIIDTSEKLLLGTLSPITTLLCKATAALTAGPVTTNFQIWSGTIASGANSGFTTLPAIELQDAKASGDYFVAHGVNNGWVSPKAGGGDSIVTGTLSADNLTGATPINFSIASVTQSVANPCAIPGGSGDTGVIAKSGSTYTLLNMLHTSYQVQTDEQVDGASFEFEKKTRTIRTPRPAAESSWTVSHTGEEC